MSKYKIIDPNTTFIDESVVIEEDVVIYPNVTIRGNSIIGKKTIIDSNTIIVDSIIGAENYIISSVIDKDNIIGSRNKIGPFTHLRMGNRIGNNNHIGSFVEIKESTIGNDNFAMHLSYVGNAELENHVNVGAGVVFANYHSKKDKKYHSSIENAVSIGSNTTLVAPIIIKENTLIGAGTTVVKDIDKNSLYINRGKEVYKKGYYDGGNK